MKIGPLLATLACAEITWGTTAAGMWDVTLDDFPRLAGETDDAARLQRAVDATGNGRVLCLPHGLYEASRTVWVTNGASLLLHKTATVRATAKMDHLFHVENAAKWAWTGQHPSFDQAPFFTGGHLDGNGLASCLYLNRYLRYTVRDVVFVNGFPYGFHVGRSGSEIVADNLYFRTNKRGLAGNIALFTEGNDSYYSNISAMDYTIGLKTTGAANGFFHYHVWGGPIPPVAKGRLPEMLENSVCFDLGGHMNILRDSYADTGEVGFKVSGWGQQIVGCWFLNNTYFGMKDVTVLEQDPASVDLLIADCCFQASGPETKLYRGPGAVKWRDMVYRNFPGHLELPGEINTGCDLVDVALQLGACKTAGDWEYVPKKLTYASVAGEFKDKKASRALKVMAPGKLVSRRFPNAGAGTGVVLRMRATDDVTKEVEFVFMQTDRRAWGTVVPLTKEWREIRLPFVRLKYFSQWGLPPLPKGEKPDARKICWFNFMYGNFLCNGTEDKPHGFEIDSIRITYEDSEGMRK